jgi:ATP-dependent Clp protease ATP-binding subunit ClpC
MFERLTEPARRIVILAQKEARLLKHDYIGTEHLLLGMLREGRVSQLKSCKASILPPIGYVRRWSELLEQGKTS